MPESTQATTTPPPAAPEAIPDPIVRNHRLQTGDQPLSYTTTCGPMPIPNDEGAITANLFFTSYVVDRAPDAPPRPLTICFNGGPGSASVWLHMGGLAPKRVKMLPDGGMPQPPFQLVDNEHSWLSVTDLVFVDPVGTGYSRATTDEFRKEANTVEGDLESVGQFIRMFISRYGRWTSPLFLAGESYGTFRAAGLAGKLVEKGIALNGIILISSILNMQTARFTSGNDLPYQLFFPTYAATAWFHGRLDAELQAKPIREFLNEVETWVEAVYVPSLSAGDRLRDTDRQRVVDGLIRYTGIAEPYLRQTNFRLDIHQFTKELLRADAKTVGRLDSRFTGVDRSGVTDQPDYDPSLNGIRPPFTSVLNQYIREELGYESDVEYHILRGLDWGWGDAARGYADTSDLLREAFAKNPYMRVYVASGYYDLATPYYATEYTLNHSNLPPGALDQIKISEFETGHMVYIDGSALVKLRDDVVAFIEAAVPPV
jgi:carboxypeptidase C (cathepsin A)